MWMMFQNVYLGGWRARHVTLRFAGQNLSSKSKAKHETPGAGLRIHTIRENELDAVSNYSRRYFMVEKTT
jgi:hypothetical protein